MAIDFPDSPSLNDTYVAGGKTYKWDGTAWEIYGPNVSPGTFKIDDVNNRVGINTASPTVALDVTGDVSISGELTSRGYRYVDTLYFTSSGTFTKATYPWLRAVRVKLVGAGGGGGGGGPTGVGGMAAPGAGGGAGYSESFITNIAGLAASETVTVGSGGAGAAAGSNSGSAGGNSSFGSLVTANGGGGGGAGVKSSTYPSKGGSNGSGGSIGTGDLVIKGSGGDTSIVWNFANWSTPVTGSSMFGTQGGRFQNTTTAPASAVGGYGAGGGPGGATSGQVATPGADGGDGLVIVELFA